MQPDELNALLEDHAKRHSVPGAAIGIVLDGAVTTASYGVADVRTGEPVTTQTRFSPGSLTKSMVATVIVRLAHAGRLALDDPVAGHVPELRGVGWAGRATLRDLLANRSGLPLREDLEFGFEGRRDADDDALSRLASDVGAGEPAGSFWSYTNVGWCLLGRAIETASDGPWESAMRRHLFDPAGMAETAFATVPNSTQRASGHAVTADGPKPVPPLVTRAYGPAGTTVVSTLTDVLRFGTRLLEDPSLAILRATAAEVSIHGWLDAWCLGLARFDWGGTSVWGWDGLINGERSFLRIVPDQRTAVVLMTNSSTGRRMSRSLFAELLGSHAGLSVPSLRLEAADGAAGDLGRFAGVYAWPDRRVEVSSTPNRTLLIRSSRGDSEARPIDDRTFLVDPEDPDNPTVTFDGFDGDGRPRVLYLMLWGLPRLDD